MRKAGLVEGKKPHLHISSAIEQATNTQVRYIKTRRQDDAFYQKLVLDYLAQFGQASRKDVDELLMDKIPESFNKKQKSNKIGDLLTNLRRSGKIKNTGSRTAPKWVLGDE